MLKNLQETVDFSMKTLLMIVVLAALVMSQFVFEADVTAPDGPHDSLIFSPNSKSLVFDTQRYMKNEERNRFIQIWTLGKDDKFQKTWFRGQGNTAVSRLIELHDNQNIVMDKYDAGSKRFFILEPDSDGKLNWRKPDDAELEHSIQQAAQHARYRKLDLSQGDPSKLNTLLKTHNDYDTSRLLFAWRDSKHVTHKFSVILTPENTYRVVTTDSTGKEFGHIDVTGADLQKAATRVRAILETIYKLELRHSPGCKYFILEQQKLDEGDARKRMLVDSNLNMISDSIGTPWSFSQDGELLVYFSEEEQAHHVIRCRDGKTIFEGDADGLPQTRLMRVAISNDGRFLASSATLESKGRYLGPYLRVWDTEKNAAVNEIKLPNSNNFLITNALFIVWGLVFGRFCLKPAKPHPITPDFVRYVSIMASVVFIGGFCCSGVLIMHDDGLLFPLVVGSIMLVPSISRRLQKEGDQEVEPEPESPID